MADKIYNLSSDDENSQNFVLKLTNSIIIDETLDENNFNVKDNKNDVIIINDSSDDSFESTSKENRKQEPLMLHNKNDKNYNLSLSSFDASEIFTEDETKSSWDANKIFSSNAKKTTNYKTSISNNSKNLILPNKEIISNKENRDSNNILMKKIRENNEIIKQPKQIIPKIGNCNINEYDNKPRDSPNSAKFGIRTTPLTKKEARNILKAVKSQRIVHDSPGQWSRNRHNKINSSESDTSENSVDDQCYDSPLTKKIIHPAWIDETDSEADVPKNLQTESSNLQKPKIVQGINKIELQNDLLDSGFERKKQDISRWLISNSFNRKSDSSVSQVAPSERSSIHSGNSSLERLEENYETPNNRDKFHSRIISHDSESDKVNSITRSIKVHTIKEGNNTTSKKSKPKDLKKYPSVLSSKRGTNSSSSSEEVLSQNVENCVDILNKLYGNSWKSRADILLPNTPIITTDKRLLVRDNRAVQSDRKVNLKTREKNINPSINNFADKRLNTLAENTKIKTKTNLTSLKKPNEKYESSFIDDSSPDNTDGETTYLTALTTPAMPRHQLLTKETSASTLKQKAFDICDSDTDEDDDNIGKRKNENYQRRLDFSDDEKSSSICTSEYDPDDIIPPKALPKVCTGSRSNVRTKPETSQSNVKMSFLKSLSVSVPINLAHPNAIKYRTNFKTTKDELCTYLYRYYNEKIFENKLPNDMLIEWSTRMRGTAGFCYNKSKRKAFGEIERSSRIQLATKVLDSADRVRDTLLHEMCHAATWIINHVSEGHGVCWRAWASKAMKIFPELPRIDRCHDYKIATKFTYRCMTCGYCVGRHSKSLDTARKRCGHCHGKFELLINRTTKSGRIEREKPKVKPPSKFALFVKENYRDVKRKYQDIDHKEIMKVLGQQFTAMNIAK